MVDPVPAVVASFFAQYPNGKDLLMKQDGSKVYLNHFQDQAVQEAKRSSGEIWKIDKDNTQLRVYPEGQPAPPVTYTYNLDYDTNEGDVTTVTIGEDEFAVSTSDAAELQSTFESAFTSKGLTGTVNVLEEGTLWTITVEIDAEATMSITNNNAQTYTLTLV